MVAGPTAAGRRLVKATLVACGDRVRPVTLQHLAHSNAALRGLATVMERAVEEAASSNGRIDWMMAAAHMWGVMKENQKR